MNSAFIYIISSVLILVIIKDIQPNIAMLGGVFVTIVTVIAAVNEFSTFTEFIRKLSSGDHREDIMLMLKVTGISICADVGADICVQAGYSSTAKSILLYGKVSILLLALPLITELSEGVQSFFS